MGVTLGGRYAAIVNTEKDERLFGLVDMHLHPAAHIGFGGEVFYGGRWPSPTP